MINELKIFIPCEVFEMDVCLGPQESVSPIESLFIEAISSGKNTIDVLVDFFQLGTRPTFNLISDLWRNGYIGVDPFSGKINLSKYVSELLNKGKLGELSPIESSHQTVLLMQDLFSGQVLPAMEPERSDNYYKVAPQLINFGSYRKVPVAMMSDVLLRVIRELANEANGAREPNSFRFSRIISASLKMGTHLGTPHIGERRLISVFARCSQTLTKKLTLDIYYPKYIARHVRQQWEDSFSKRADEMPDEQFFKMLRENVTVTEEAPVPSPQTLVSDLVDKAQSLNSDSESLESSFQKISDLFEKAREAISQRLSQQVISRVVVGSIELEQIVTDSILKAKSQLIISCPTIEHNILIKYALILEARMDKGVKVFVLWGHDPKQLLDERVKNLFIYWKKRFRNFFWNEVPALSNERFFIRDDDHAVFCSSQYMSCDRSEMPMLAVEIKPIDLKPIDQKMGCRAIADQIERVSRLISDSRVRNQLGVRGDYFASLNFWTAKLPLIPNYPHIIKKDGYEAYNNAAVANWKDHWVNVAKGMQDELNNAHNTAVVIHDRSHHDHLLIAIKESTTRLVLISDVISNQTFNQEFEDAILELSKKTPVLIIYEIIPQNDLLITERLARLHAEQETMFLAVRKNCSGGLIIADDKILVTSQGLLSQATCDVTVGRLGRCHEAGLLVRNIDLADNAFEFVASMIPETEDLFIGVRSGTSNYNDFRLNNGPTRNEVNSNIPEFTIDGCLTAIQDLVVPLSEVVSDSKTGLRGQSDLLYRWFSRADNRWEEINLLVRLLPYEMRRMAIANCLDTAGDVESKEGIHWQMCLVADCWQRGDFNEATALLLGINDPPSIPGVPPLWIAKLMVFRFDNEIMEDLVTELFPRDLSPQEALAVLFISFPLLLHGLPMACDILENCRCDLPSSLTVFLEAALMLWTETLQPLPVNELSDHRAANLARQRCDTAYERLCDSLLKAENIHQKHIIIRHTWLELFKRTGIFGSLKAAIECRSTDQITEWIESFGNEDMGTILDKVSMSLGYIETIDGNPRLACIKRLVELTDSVKGWIEMQKFTSSHIANQNSLRMAAALEEDYKRNTRLFLSQITRESANEYQGPLANDLLTQLDIIFGVSP
jgi:hypothetical protein